MITSSTPASPSMVLAAPAAQQSAAALTLSTSPIPVALAFDDLGTGRPVVFIHAFPLDRTMWQPTFAVLAGLRLIAPDLRGFGASPQTDGEAVTMRTYAADVVGLLDQLGLDRATICGLSLGGYVALAIAENYPERVESLILANSRATDDDSEAQAKRHALADRVAAEGVGVLAAEVAPKLLGPLASAAALSLVGEIVERQHPSAAVSAIRGMAGRSNRTASLAAIDVPTLVITSELDTVVTPAASQAMSDAIAGSTLVTIAGAGHLSSIEDPAAFARAVADHLRVTE